MTLMWWQECTRGQLSELLPQALVIVSTGAVEQHGPHLPTGTDSLLSGEILRRATKMAEADCAYPLIVLPPLWFGSSDHHLRFGGTVSFSVQTMTSALVDIARTVGESGGQRLLIVNGHGGNKGPCESAAAIASVRHRIVVSYIHYWELAEPTEFVNAPGHAGAFETSLMNTFWPELVDTPPERETAPDSEHIPGVTVHDSQEWQRIDGYTDYPDAFTEGAGRRWFETATHQLAGRIRELAAR